MNTWDGFEANLINNLGSLTFIVDDFGLDIFLITELREGERSFLTVQDPVEEERQMGQNNISTSLILTGELAPPDCEYEPTKQPLSSYEISSYMRVFCNHYNNQSTHAKRDVNLTYCDYATYPDDSNNIFATRTERSQRKTIVFNYEMLGLDYMVFLKKLELCLSHNKKLRIKLKFQTKEALEIPDIGETSSYPITNFSMTTQI